MGAIVNGIAAHGGLRPFGATFFVFSDYLRPTIRIAALSELPSIFVFTHDSIGLGEDGPTHQPVEHLASLRAMPGVRVMRPADARETAESWAAALSHQHGPTVLVLSRQNLPQHDRAAGAEGTADGARNGAYVLRGAMGSGRRVTLLATGSEVAVVMEAAPLLEAKGYSVRVVSMPCWEIFDAQDTAYRAAVLGPPDEARLAVEAGASFGWERYTGGSGRTLCIDRFGASAPAATLMEQLGLTPAAVVETVERLFPVHRS
jgi:transketolase